MGGPDAPNQGSREEESGRQEEGRRGATVPNGVFVALDAPDDSRLAVETRQGNFTVALADLSDGSIKRYLAGQVEAQVVPTAVTFHDGPDQEDFPAAAADGRGNVWVACVVHQPRGPAKLDAIQERPKSFADFVPTGGGDQVRLLKYAGGKAGEPLDVTANGLDVWRPSVAVDRDGAVVVVWSETRDGNWDLYQRTYNPSRGSFSETKRLTRGEGTDTHGVLATAPDGKVWLAWQSFSEGQADILLAPLDGSSPPAQVSSGPADEWSPAMYRPGNGRITWPTSTYQAGNYDVMLRTRGSDGTLGNVRTIASSSRFEARPSVAADAQGRVWVAYEERTSHWGKDFGPLAPGEGTALYRASTVRVRCLDGDRLLDAPDPVAGAAAVLQTMNGFPRIAADRSGRIWLVYRHRQEGQSSGVGGTWIGYATALAGNAWTIPARDDAGDDG